MSLLFIYILLNVASKQEVPVRSSPRGLKGELLKLSTGVLTCSFLSAKKPRERKRLGKHGKCHVFLLLVGKLLWLPSSNQIYSICLKFVFLPSVWPALHGAYWGRTCWAQLSPVSGSHCSPSSFSTQVLAKMNPAAVNTSVERGHPPTGFQPHKVNPRWQGWLLSPSLLKTQCCGTGGWAALAGAPFCTFFWLRVVKKLRKNVDKIMRIKRGKKKKMDEVDGKVRKRVGFCGRICVNRKVIEIRWDLAEKKMKKTSLLMLWD